MPSKRIFVKCVSFNEHDESISCFRASIPGKRQVSSAQIIINDGLDSPHGIAYDWIGRSEKNISTEVLNIF